MSLGIRGFASSHAPAPSRPWGRSWAVMVALSAVVVTSASLRWTAPCWTTVVAFERLRQTHVRVKNRESPDVIMVSGCMANVALACRTKGPICCTLHRRVDDLCGMLPPVCHPGPLSDGDTRLPLSARSPTSPPCGAHGISACLRAIRPRLRLSRRGCAGERVGRRTHSAPTRVWGVDATGQTPTSSGWISHEQPQVVVPPGLRARDRLCWGLLRGRS